MKKTRQLDLTKPRNAVIYLNQALQKKDYVFRKCLMDVIKVQEGGVSYVAKKVGTSRASIYNCLKKESDIRYGLLMKILKVLRLQSKVVK